MVLSPFMKNIKGEKRMIRLNEIEVYKCNLIFDYYNKICPHPLSSEEKYNFINSVYNLSKELNKELFEVLDICYEFAFCFYKISDICNLTKSSIVLSRLAEL